jgi:hypothetical protein
MREKVFQEITGLDPEQAEVDEVVSGGLPLNLPQASQQTFHAEKVPVGLRGGILDKKRTVTAAELHFEGLTTGEQRIQGKRIENRLETEDERSSRCRGRDWICHRAASSDSTNRAREAV